MEPLKGLQRELELLRAQPDKLLFAEAALVLMILERFLRTLRGLNATDKESLPQLLQRATSLGLLKMADTSAIDQIRRVRNALFHGNLEQMPGMQLASEVEKLHLLTQNLIAQIDPKTGLRV